MSHTSGTDAAKMEWRLLAPVFSWFYGVCLGGVMTMTDVRSKVVAFEESYWTKSPA